MIASKRALLRTDSNLVAWRTRGQRVIAVLSGDDVDLSGASRETICEAITARLGTINAANVWLVLSALSGELPSDRRVMAVLHEASDRGPMAVLEAAWHATSRESVDYEVEILPGRTLIDVDYVAGGGVFTGIQRVAVELSRHWSQHHNITLVAWTDDKRALRLLSDDEVGNVLGQDAAVSYTTRMGARGGRYSQVRSEKTRVIPWRSKYIIVELPGHFTRIRRLLAMARHSPNTTGSIAFDTVPLTFAETTADGFPDHFALNLAMLRHFDRISAISRSTADEYRAWRETLITTGWSGPEIRQISLPVEPLTAAKSSYEQVRDRFTLPATPMVLCVGSHDPRKNHLAVLAAADSLWRRGFRFSLLFVAGNAWQASDFYAELRRLQDAGRPVDDLGHVNDSTLGSLYRIARLTVFPSLAEGYGLPVAESLAVGTPVVTSNYGSMAEICANGGALLVNPRDDNAIAAAMGNLLRDDELHARLSVESRRLVTRTWAEYAEENWSYFTREPSGDASNPS